MSTFIEEAAILAAEEKDFERLDELLQKMTTRELNELQDAALVLDERIGYHLRCRGDGVS